MKRNKINKPLSNLSRKKERTQINKIRNERGEIIPDTTEIQRIVRNCDEELHVKEFENVGEMDKLLETYNIPKWNAEETESLK